MAIFPTLQRQLNSVLPTLSTATTAPNVTTTPPINGPITVGSRTISPDPFTGPPRSDFSGTQSAIQQLMGMQVGPQALFRTRAEPVIANQRANARNVAGDAIRAGLGPAFGAQYARRNAFDTSALLGQLAGTSQIDATTANTGIVGSALNSMLGLNTLVSGERQQDIGQSANILDYIASIFGSSR